jgi:coenzyme F420-reducing hydrogenase alpha subunit
MKKSEVKELNQKLINLANHSIEKGVDNFHFNYALGINIDRFAAEVKSYKKEIPKELVEIEQKIISLAHEQYIKMTEEEKELAKDDLFELGFNFLTDKEKEQHEELMKVYDKILEKESELKIYFFNPEKIDDVKLEFTFSEILRKNFFKQD